jgi:hypothetical protein
VRRKPLTGDMVGASGNCRKSNDKAADRKSRGFFLHKCFLGLVSKTNSLAGWPHVSLHRFLQPFLVLAACGTSAVCRMGCSFFQTFSNPQKASTRVRGRGLCILSVLAGAITTSLLVLKSNRAPLNFWPVIAFSLVTAFAYCPVANCGWPNVDSCFSNSNGKLIAKLFFG